MVINGITFLVVNLFFQDPMDWKKFLGFYLFEGVILALPFSLWRYFELKRKGISHPKLSDMFCKASTELYFEGNWTALKNRLNTYVTYKRMKKKDNPQQLILRSDLGWNVGEVITITEKESTEQGLKLFIESRPKYKWTIEDFGANRKHIATLKKILTMPHQ